MPGQGAEIRAGYITQLGFDSLAAGSESDSGAGAVEKLHGIATAGIREVRRSAPPRRYKAKKHALIDGITQATFDGLFDRIPGEEQEQAIQSEETREDNEQNGRIKSINFEPLVSVSPDDGSRVSEGEPAGRRVGEDSAAGWHIVTEVNPHGQDGLPGSNGDSQGTILPARGRRVILDEPEPGRQPSRDFRITEAHRVGTGGLHEKATTNIAAIRLLKTLEAESRDATDEEKAVLVKYAGWGALPQVFEPSYLIRQEWRAAATELQSLLTDEEYEKARATTPNAHFTSPVVVSTIWQGLQKLGIRGNIEVLEPACGAGHFLGLMPEELQGGHRTGVELDSITARIAKKLYPDSTIFEKGFEETPLPNDYFDAVVGNVPFGDYGVHDPSMKKSLTRAIHDYFFAKSAEKVRPGGILALITSRYTMDKQDETIRRYLAEKADLVAAVRLPNTAFKGNAGTEVVTDILFLQKRIDGKEPAGSNRRLDPRSFTESHTCFTRRCIYSSRSPPGDLTSCSPYRT